jgi:hypothetical protein
VLPLVDVLFRIPGWDAVTLVKIVADGDAVDAKREPWSRVLAQLPPQEVQMTTRKPSRSAVAAAAQAHEAAVRAAREKRAASRLPVGQLAYDTRRERWGVVMDHLEGQVWLRPEGGGVEWTAKPGEVEPAASVADGGVLEGVLRARVAVANSRSRRELL